MAKIGAREEQLRAMRKTEVAAKAAPRNVKLDQALAAAQGRGLDAMLLGSHLPTASAAAEPSKEKTVTLTELATAIETPALKAGPKLLAKKFPVAPKKAKPEPIGKARKAAKAKAPEKAKDAKKAAPVKKVAAKVAKAAGGRPDGLREGSKQAIMLDLALRGEGATEAAMCKKLGWKKCRVTLKRVAEKVGAKLDAKKNAAGETVYFAAMKR